MHAVLLCIVDVSTPSYLHSMHTMLRQLVTCLLLFTLSAACHAPGAQLRSVCLRGLSSACEEHVAGTA